MEPHHPSSVPQRRVKTRVSESEIAAASAVPITDVVGGVNRRGFILCPFHEERTPSLHVDTKRNRWKCFGCGKGGNAITFVMEARGLDFVAAVRELAGRALEPLPRAARQLMHGSGRRLVSPASVPPLVQQLWDGADAPELAELYLYSRGIRVRPRPLPWALRGHKRVWCSEARGYRPAVLAAVTASDGTITALQRTWVDPKYLVDGGVSPAKGSRSLHLKVGKKTLGPLGAGAVRLAEACQVIGIAEGVETALSAAQLYRCRVWAALGASRLGSIELPSEVKRVIIFGDNGAAGEQAAAKAESAYKRRGYACEMVFPDRGKDFNEMLIGGLS